MKTQIIMPRCGVDMEEGTLIQWYKQEGELIKKGEPFFSIETDKAVQDMESDCDGYLRRVIVHEGETVLVGTTVAIITTSLEDAY